MLQKDVLALPEEIVKKEHEEHAEQADAGKANPLLTRKELTSIAVSKTKETIDGAAEAALVHIIKSSCADTGLFESFIDAQEAKHGETQAFETRKIFVYSDGGKDAATLKSSVTLFMDWLEEVEKTSTSPHPPSQPAASTSKNSEQDLALLDAAMTVETAKAEVDVADGEKVAKGGGEDGIGGDDGDKVHVQEAAPKVDVAKEDDVEMDEDTQEPPPPPTADVAPAQVAVADGGVDEKQKDAKGGYDAARAAPAEAGVEVASVVDAKDAKGGGGEGGDKANDADKQTEEIVAAAPQIETTSAAARLDRVRSIEAEEKMKLKKLNMKGDGGLKRGIVSFDSCFCGRPAGANCNAMIIDR